MGWPKNPLVFGISPPFLLNTRQFSPPLSDLSFSLKKLTGVPVTLTNHQGRRTAVAPVPEGASYLCLRGLPCRIAGTYGTDVSRTERGGYDGELRGQGQPQDFTEIQYSAAASRWRVHYYSWSPLNLGVMFTDSATGATIQDRVRAQLERQEQHQRVTS